jgi:hypothetical protein
LPILDLGDFRGNQASRYQKTTLDMIFSNCRKSKTKEKKPERS